MVAKYTNFATSTLASGIIAGDTALTVFAGDGTKFPSLGAGEFFYAVLENLAGIREIVKVTARTGDTFTTIVRAQDGTSALSWNAGDKVELRIVNANVSDYASSTVLATTGGAALVGATASTNNAGATVQAQLTNVGSATGSSNVGHTGTGTAVVATTVQNKLREVISVKEFGAVGDGTTDDTAAIQAAIDSVAGSLFLFFPAGTYKLTSTIYLKRSHVHLRGAGPYNTNISYVNAAGGTAIAGATGGITSTSTITDCSIKEMGLISVAAATDPSIWVDLTTFSYSEFDLQIQSKRANATLYYGQGNAGTSPYYNRISGSLYGNTDLTQIGIKFNAGTWAGGSNGPNANIIGPIKRAASLGGLVDLVSGTGNLFSNINGETIGSYYFRLNNVASFTDTGTSSGTNTGITLNDTTKTWTVNAFANYAVKITSGTGSGQVRKIKSNSATALTIDNCWATIPDATSTYAIAKNQAVENKIVNCRAEGSASNNPDFISALPGTYGNRVTGSSVQSLGTGLFVRDDSGNLDNTWYDGHKVVFKETVLNPGPGANIDVYPRLSAIGGVTLTNYTLNWLSAACNEAAPGDTATIRLDVGGTAAGNGDMTLTTLLQNKDQSFAIPTSTQKIKRDGANRHLFLNVQTGASWTATADIVITWCATIDI